MLVLAGIASGAGLWYCSETFRGKARRAGVVLAWYGVRAYTEIEIRTEAAVRRFSEWAGWAEHDEVQPTEAELVPLCGGGDAKLFIRKTLVAGGGAHVAVGRSEDEIADAPRSPCKASIYAPVVRVKGEDGNVRSYPIDFEGEDYCLAGNVLFDPVFTAYWLSTRYSVRIQSGETWETSFVGPGMVPQTVSHEQRLVCTEAGMHVEALKREEPAGGPRDTSPGAEAWLLDLDGKPSP